METLTGRKIGSLRKWSYNNVGLIFIAPWILGFLFFTLYPFIDSLLNSFTDTRGARTGNFIGFDNYVHMFTVDLRFWQSVRVTLLYVIMTLPMRLGFALFIAMLLNMKLRGVNLYRTFYYIPSLLGGGVAVSIVWRMLFLRTGVINQMLATVGISPVGWLSDPNIALFTISLLSVWQFGSSMVIFLAGLKQIPNELYEAARVDGASKIRIFFKITLPMLTPVILFNLVMQMINAFQEFTSAFIITDGGPLQGTFLYAFKLFVEAFRNFRFGYASALSWVLFIVIVLVTALIFKVANRFVHYEN